MKNTLGKVCCEKYAGKKILQEVHCKKYIRDSLQKIYCEK